MQTKIEIFAENKIRWAVEIKWKTKAAGINEIQSFCRNASLLTERWWYISSAGFTEEAKGISPKKGVLFSTVNARLDSRKYDSKNMTKKAQKKGNKCHEKKKFRHFHDMKKIKDLQNLVSP